MLADAWAWKLSHPTGYAKRKPRPARNLGTAPAPARPMAWVRERGDPEAMREVATRVSA